MVLTDMTERARVNEKLQTMQALGSAQEPERRTRIHRKSWGSKSHFGLFRKLILTTSNLFLPFQSDVTRVTRHKSSRGLFPMCGHDVL